jgi:hypothetical protein
MCRNMNKDISRRQLIASIISVYHMKGSKGAYCINCTGINCQKDQNNNHFAIYMTLLKTKTSWTTIYYEFTKSQLMLTYIS